MSKKAKDDYIRVNKTITHPKVLGGIRSLADELALTEQEACYYAIKEAATRQNEKRIKNSMYGGLKN